MSTNDSFIKWRDSSQYHQVDSKSFVISDSEDEDIIQNSFKERLLIDESNEDNADVSQDTIPTKKNIKHIFKRNNIVTSDDSTSDEAEGDETESNEGYETSHNNSDDSDKYYVEDEDYESLISYSLQQKKGKKRKDVSHDNTREDIKEFKKSTTIVLDSDSGENSGSDLAVSLAKQEIGIGNVNPVIAQKKADNTREDIKEFNKSTIIVFDSDSEENSGSNLAVSVVKNEQFFSKKKSMFPNKDSSSNESHSSLNVDYMKPTTSAESRELGKRAQATRDKELALTVERLQDLHGSLVARPPENEEAEDPRGLKVPLMPHQQHALAWLMWREQQRPAGGVLADDMGLGKTLTMISLIMANLDKKNSTSDNDESNDSDSNSGWSKKKPLRHSGGTLVICPASLLSQWEKEVQDKCKRGVLSVQVYHGTNRENVSSRLAKNNIVITTYNIVAREFKVNSTLFQINWKRVILDEAHIIRNHKSQAAEAVCGLIASKRWALTGTPIQNKEIDLYSILKFLKCTPFDDLRVWKRWVDNKNAAGHQRLATVMKTLMLRRTKQELQSQGRLEHLPEKFIEEVIVELDSKEQRVYQKILIYSHTLFAQFLAQRAEKDHMFDLHSGMYNKPTFLSNPNKETQFTKAQKKLLAMHADVKTHEILVLLLRLRQVCCHPALIHAMLDQEEMQVSGIMNEEGINPEVLSQFSNISLKEVDNHEHSEEEDEEIGIDRKIIHNILTADNPVFNDDRIGSKMKALLDVVKTILQTNDKIIIVSQWSTLLDVIASHLKSIKGATFATFTGSVAIKNRPAIIDAFNKSNSGPRILLLSLTAGGVGLNLVGGNHLLMFDIHWNPQLETQAQDRIYRFGQKKNVYIYKFICSNTIEERIKMLQERKLAIAQNVLSGDRSKEVTKLTLNDLKSLFAL